MRFEFQIKRLASEIIKVLSRQAEILSFKSPKEYTIKEALIMTDGNKLEAALLLGVSRSTFYRKMKREGLG